MFLIVPALHGAAAATAAARAVLVRTVELAVLQALAAGPLKLSALQLVARDLSRKRFWRIVDGMHHAGTVKRLGVRGWSVWCLSSYTGPRPVVVHPAHVVRRRPVVAAPPRTSWWLDLPTRTAFEHALKTCIKARGWGP